MFCYDIAMIYETKERFQHHGIFHTPLQLWSRVASICLTWNLTQSSAQSVVYKLEGGSSEVSSFTTSDSSESGLQQSTSANWSPTSDSGVSGKFFSSPKLFANRPSNSAKKWEKDWGSHVGSHKFYQILSNVLKQYMEKRNCPSLEPMSTSWSSLPKFTHSKLGDCWHHENIHAAKWHDMRTDMDRFGKLSNSWILPSDAADHSQRKLQHWRESQQTWNCEYWKFSDLLARKKQWQTNYKPSNYPPSSRFVNVPSHHLYTLHALDLLKLDPG